MPVMDSRKALPLIETSRRCWDGRVGENETLPLVQQLTEGFTESELKRVIALLLNDISGYGRQALARQCCHFDRMQTICKC